MPKATSSLVVFCCLLDYPEKSLLFATLSNLRMGAEATGLGALVGVRVMFAIVWFYLE